MNKYLDIAPEVAEALAAGKPVVALESTIISRSSRSSATRARSPRPSPSSAAA